MTCLRNAIVINSLKKDYENFIVIEHDGIGETQVSAFDKIYKKNIIGKLRLTKSDLSLHEFFIPDDYKAIKVTFKLGQVYQSFTAIEGVDKSGRKSLYMQDGKLLIPEKIKVFNIYIPEFKKEHITTI